MVAKVVTEGTAAALVDTAPVVEDAPPAIEQPETPDAAAPETALEAAPETAQDAKSWADHLVDVDEDELVNHDRIKSILARREESTRRKVERDQQLKAGSDQQVQSVVSYLMQRLDSGEVTPQQFAQTAAQAIQAAKFYASVEMGKQLPDLLMSNYKIPVDYRERALEAKLDDNGNLDRYTRILIDGAVASERGTTRLKDVPEGSALHKDVQAEVSKRVEADLRARGVEAQTRLETPPPTTRGAERSSSITPYHLMTREQRQAMSPAERDAAIAVSYGAH